MNRLIIVRGLPGSGKTTVARRMLGPTGKLCEADQYFVNENGEYHYIPEEAGAAHTECFRNVLQHLGDDVQTVVVANTFTQRWEAAPYIALGKALGYRVEITLPGTTWQWSPSLCAKRCVHGVPLNVIEGMLARWEQHVQWLR